MILTFIPLAMSVAGAVILIVVLLLVAAAIGVVTTWFMQNLFIYLSSKSLRMKKRISRKKFQDWKMMYGGWKRR